MGVVGADAESSDSRARADGALLESERRDEEVDDDVDDVEVLEDMFEWLCCDNDSDE